MPYYEGPLNCNIAFVLQSPGEIEVQRQRPCVGRAGKLWENLLPQASIVRSQCYIDNVLQFRPANNNVTPYIKFPKYRWQKATTSEVWDKSVEALDARLSCCTANVIVAHGNEAIYALTGKWGATKYRGSLLPCTLPSNKGRKIICAVHPSFLLDRYEGSSTADAKKGTSPAMWKVFTVFDLRRAMEQSFDTSIPRIQRVLEVATSVDHTVGYLNAIHSYENPISVDIETRGKFIACISIAITIKEALCIPFMKGLGDYWTPDDELVVLKALTKVLENPKILKIGQNFKFDMTALYHHFGIKTFPIVDTMIAQATQNPEFPKGLDFLTSVYTLEPYYKDDGKEWHNMKLFGDEENFWRYNNLDTTVTYEVFNELMQELEESGNLETFWRQNRLTYPLMYVEQRGLLVDQQGLKAEAEKNKYKLEESKKTLSQLLPGINPNSSKQLMEYFYDQLGISPYYKVVKKDGVREKTKTIDASALAKIAKKGYVEAQALLDYRKMEKMETTYYTIPLDPDGRLRAEYKPTGTKAGRISSAKNWLKTGMNMQNMPYMMLKYITVDEGYYPVAIDLSQAENRVVAYIANDAVMMEAFERGDDIHTIVAAMILGKTPEEVSREEGSSGIANYSERDIGKRCGHGLNYGMGPYKFAEWARLPNNIAKSYRDAYYSRFPSIPDWHKSVRQKIMIDRTLVNVFGRQYKFWGQTESSMFEFGYSFNPQSTVADLNNLITIYIHEDCPEVIPAFFVHDSNDFMMPYNIDFLQAAVILQDIKAVAEQTLTYQGRDFSIPLDISVGRDNFLELTELEPNDTTNIDRLAGKLSEICGK